GRGAGRGRGGGPPGKSSPQGGRRATLAALRCAHPDVDVGTASFRDPLGGRMSDAYGVPPQAPPAAQRTGPRAGFGERLVAAIIDGVIIGVANGVLFGVLHAAGYGLGSLAGLAY